MNKRGKFTKKYIAVSDVAALDYCKRKLYLTKVLGHKEQYSKRLSIGKIKHEVFEKVNELDQNWIINKPEKIETYYHNELNSLIKRILKKYEKEAIEFDTDMKQLQIDLRDFFSRFIKIRIEQIKSFVETSKLTGVDLWKSFEPKIATEKFIQSENHKVRGIVDYIECYKNKNVPVEIKTGSIPPNGVWPSHQVQLSIYMLLLEEEYGIKCEEGFVYYIDHDKKVEIRNNEFLENKTKNKINEVFELLTSNKIPEFVKNRNKCESCSLKSTCYSIDS